MKKPSTVKTPEAEFDAALAALDNALDEFAHKTVHPLTIPAPDPAPSPESESVSAPELRGEVNTDELERTLAQAINDPKSQRRVGLKTGDPSIGINPKDRTGASKVDFSLIPTSAKIALALALMDGADKYGQYNWRVEAVQARTYINAAERHLEAYKESEQHARDSRIHHLGHLMASAAILIDAEFQKMLIDDRPINGIGAQLIEDAHEWIKSNKPAGWGR